MSPTQKQFFLNQAALKKGVSAATRITGEKGIKR
jgi:hypothetical protein